MTQAEELSVKMGYGYSFYCEKCKKGYSIRLGWGFGISGVFNETLEEIGRGVWGTEYKRILDTTPYISTDVELYLFICDNCSSWKVEKGMDLYAPKDPDYIPVAHMRLGGRSFDVRGMVSPAIPGRLENYHLVKKYDHICECGKSMRKASELEMQYLSCPCCGTQNVSRGTMCWD